MLFRSKSVSHEFNHGFNGENKCRDRRLNFFSLDIAVPKNKTKNPSDRNVTQGNIDAIFKNVTFDKSGKGNIGNARPFKYDKDSPGYLIQIKNE